jgi:hypothetical protein
MKRFLPVLIFSIFYAATLHAQTPAMGPAEKKITDTLCDCVANLDISKITTKDQAIAAYTDCIGKHIDLFTDFAKERNEDITSESAGERLGLIIAKDLMARNCQGFVKLSLLSVKKDDAGAQTTSATEGHLKRIDNKGFNYIIIADANNNEKSFLWLRQFPGSEHFIGGTSNLIGKKLKIEWQEIEVYLPEAKGYYKVKEITSITLL